MRLDVLMTERAWAASRTKAQEMIKNGCVSVNGRVACRPSLEVSDEDLITVNETEVCRYVSRGGLKLEAALVHFGISPKDEIAIDVGASSGGFTDCLLQNGARLVYAVDSGRDQLHPSLREDARVIVMENKNARYLERVEFEPRPGFGVMDVSFISQTLILPTLYGLLAEGGRLVTLIKPQFEAGRAAVGKGGIVRREADRKLAVRRVIESAEAIGFRVCGYIESPITGGDGNIEYLALLVKQTEQKEEKAETE